MTKINFKTIKNWLTKPYPFIANTKDKLLIAFIIGLFVFLFLMIFKPFDLYKFTESEVFHFSLLYSSIPFLIILINVFIFPMLFNSFFKSNTWKIYKEIIFIFEIILISAILNWLFSDFSTFYKKDGLYGLWFFVWTTFSVSFFPLLIHIYFTEKKQSKKHQKIADDISGLKNNGTIIKNNANLSNIIEIKGENKNEVFVISIKKLLYINSEKNYASIFYLDDKCKINEIVIRASLNKLENQLNSYKSIIRCHKSYIINTIHVKKLLGNARNYTLQLNFNEIKIPVSRKFPKELLYTLLQK